MTGWASRALRAAALQRQRPFAVKPANQIAIAQPWAVDLRRNQSEANSRRRLALKTRDAGPDLSGWRSCGDQLAHEREQPIDTGKEGEDDFHRRKLGAGRKPAG